MAAIVNILIVVLTFGCAVKADDEEELLQQLQQQVAELKVENQNITSALAVLFRKVEGLHTALINRIARCSVEVLAYSANNIGVSSNGFVELNSVPVWQASWRGSFQNLRGVNTILVDPFNCSAIESRRFDTYGSATDATLLRDYLKELSRGTIIVGVSADEPTHKLSAALSTLRDFGVDVRDVKYRGAFVFIAQTGFPTKTVLRKARTNAQAVMMNQPYISAIVNGCSVDELSITVV